MSGYVHATVQVGSVATVVLTSPTNETGGILLRNNGPVPVYLGGSTVTADLSSTGGFLISPGESANLSNTASFGAGLYGVTASGTAYVTAIYV